MAYKRAADGIAKKGKTEGKNLGDSGPTKSIENGPARKLGGGKTDADMLAMGRGLAKVAAQKRG